MGASTTVQKCTEKCTRASNIFVLWVDAPQHFLGNWRAHASFFELTEHRYI